MRRIENLFGRAGRTHLTLALALHVLVLWGCATGDPNLKRVDGPSLELRERYMFSAVSVGGSSPQYYNALLPGVYKAELEDQDGVYYRAASALIVLGGHVDANGQREEPLAHGGFWLAKSKDFAPSVRLYYLPNAPRAGMLQNGAVVPDKDGGGLVGGGLYHMGVAFGAVEDAVGVRPNSGEPLFVPQPDNSELSRFRAAIDR